MTICDVESFVYSFRKKRLLKSRLITIREKNGKICDNIKTEAKLFHACINLFSDKFWKKLLKSHHYILHTSRKENWTYTKQAKNNAKKRKKISYVSIVTKQNNYEILKKRKHNSSVRVC